MIMHIMNSKQCQACGKAIRGRSDKRFCDDYCRNIHHNQYKQSDPSARMIREINQILTGNRNILASLFGSENHLIVVEKIKLIEMGFVFRFLTHTEQGDTGTTYLCCYEYLYTPINEKQLLIARTAITN